MSELRQPTAPIADNLKKLREQLGGGAVKTDDAAKVGTGFGAPRCRVDVHSV